MSKQEKQKLFDTSYLHIMRQGEPSIQNSLCVYKSDSGLSCAAAPFIINYHPQMEENDFCNVIKDFPEDVDPIAVNNANFVVLLQKAHDFSKDINNSRFLEKYKEIMAGISHNYGLTIPDVGQVL